MERAPEYGHWRSRSICRMPEQENISLRSGPYARSVEGHALGAVHQIDLERHVFGRVIGIGFGANADQAVAQPALQRAQRLPCEAIDRIAGGMRLRNGDAGELLAGVVVVADGTGE